MISELKGVSPKTHSSCAWNLLTHRGGGRQHVLWPSLGSLPTTVWLVSTFGSASHQGEQQLLGVASSWNPLTAGCQRGGTGCEETPAKLLTNCSLEGWWVLCLVPTAFSVLQKGKGAERDQKKGTWTAGNVYPILSITWVSSEVYN